MQRLGEQQPEDPVWARSEREAERALAELEEAEIRHGPDRREAEQRQARPFVNI